MTPPPGCPERPLTDRDLDELERLAAEATPEEPEIVFDEDEVDDGSVAVVATPRREDAEFYETARAALPSLLVEVRRSRAAAPSPAPAGVDAPASDRLPEAPGTPLRALIDRSYRYMRRCDDGIGWEGAQALVREAFRLGYTHRAVPASPEAPAPAPFLLREFAALVDAVEEAAASEWLAPNAGTAQKTDAARFALLSAISRAVSEARRGCEVCRAASASTAKTVPQGYAAGWHDAVRALASTTRGDAR